jgi:hypothetical protein
MGLLKREPPPEGVARVDFYADGDGEIYAALPAWEGDEAALVHLPAAAFDEHLTYVRFKQARASVLAEFEEHVALALEEGFAAGGWLWDMPLVDSPPAASPDAVLTTELRRDYARGRLWAKSRERP